MLVKMDLQLLNTYNHPNWLSLFGSRHFWFVRDIDIQDILFFRCMLATPLLSSPPPFPLLLFSTANHGSIFTFNA